jgi:hypothetical protein
MRGPLDASGILRPKAVNGQHQLRAGPRLRVEIRGEAQDVALLPEPDQLHQVQRVLHIVLPAARLLAQRPQFHRQHVFGDRREDAQPRPLLARVGTEQRMLRQTLHAGAQVGANAVVEPVPRPAAARRYGLCGAVEEALIRRRHGVHDGGGDAEVGDQHEA